MKIPPDVCNVLQKSELEIVSMLASTLVSAIAIVAIIVAVWQIKANSKAVRRASAYSIYQNFLKMAMDDPVIAFGKEDKIKSDPDRLAKHKWFVATMLLSFEEILATCPNQKDWTAAIESQLVRHAWHLSVSSSVNKEHWGKELTRLIKLAIIKAQSEVMGQRDAIPVANFICFRLSR